MTGSDGIPRYGYFADRTDQSIKQPRVDIYSPGGPTNPEDYQQVVNLGGGDPALKGEALSQHGFQSVQKYLGKDASPPATNQATDLPEVDPSKMDLAPVSQKPVNASTGEAEPPDFTSQFNTPIPPDQQQAYQAWKAKYAPNDDGSDYDLQGAFLSGVTPDGARGHFPDTFKKPNHPTFSDQSQYNGLPNPNGGLYQGGSWGDNDSFAPSSTNLQMYGKNGLQDYFQKEEPNSQVIWPSAPVPQTIQPLTDSEAASYLRQPTPSIPAPTSSAASDAITPLTDEEAKNFGQPSSMESDNATPIPASASVDVSGFNPETYLQQNAQPATQAAANAFGAGLVNSIGDSIAWSGHMLSRMGSNMAFPPTGGPAAAAGGGPANQSLLANPPWAKPTGQPFLGDVERQLAYQAMDAPYNTAANDLYEAAAVNLPQDPNRLGLNQAAGFAGAAAPLVASSLLGMPELGAAQMSTAMGQQNREQALQEGATEQGADFAGDVGFGTGLVGGRIFGEPAGKLLGKFIGPTVASAGWNDMLGGFTKTAALNSAKGFLDFSGMNIATGEADNAVASDQNKQNQFQLIGTALKEALPGLALGALGGIGEQAGAENAVSSAADATRGSDIRGIAAIAGQNKADFITNVSQAISNINDNSSMSPQQKLGAVTAYMNQFSPDVQSVIYQHVANVGDAVAKMNQAAQAKTDLTPTNPQTADALYKESVNTALTQAQQRAVEIEQKAEADDVALAKDNAAREEALKTVIPESESKPNAETPQGETATEAVQPAPAAEPKTPKAVEQLAEQPKSVAPIESPAPVAGERPAETAPDLIPEVAPVETKGEKPETKPPESETIAPPAETIPAKEETTQSEAPQTPPPLEGLSRAEMVPIAEQEGHLPTDITKATTGEALRNLIEAKRLAQAPESAPDSLVPSDKAMVDPKIGQLKGKMAEAVNMFLAAAKGWKGGLRGSKRFVLGEYGNSPAWADMGAERFDTVHLNPVQLARDIANMRARKMSEKEIRYNLQNLFQHEFAHNQVGAGLHNEWTSKGRPGEWSDYYNKRMASVYDRMTSKQKKYIQQNYAGHLTGMDTRLHSTEHPNIRLPAIMSEEFLRNTIEQREGGITAEEALDRIKNNKPLRTIVGTLLNRLRGISQKFIAKYGAVDPEIERMIGYYGDMLGEPPRDVPSKLGTAENPKSGAQPLAPGDIDDAWDDVASEQDKEESKADPSTFRPFVNEKGWGANVEESPQQERGVPKEAPKEQKITDRIEALKDVSIPEDKQLAYQKRAQTLARMQFSDGTNRDIAEGNAFLKATLAAKDWTQKYGSLDAPDEKGRQFAANRIIVSSLLDDGRRAKKSPTNTIQSATEEPEETEANPEDETPATPKGMDLSNDDVEAQQRAFEPTGESQNTEGVTTENPRSIAQERLVQRNVARVSSQLSPYGRRLLELWSDYPDQNDNGNPIWANRAQKELGISKEKAMADHAEITNRLKAEAQKLGLTADDFRRTAAQPLTPEGEPEKKFAPATYIGDQEDGKGGKFGLYNLTDDIPGHPIGSTVSDQTLKEAGYEIPQKSGTDRGNPEPARGTQKGATGNAETESGNVLRDQTLSGESEKAGARPLTPEDDYFGTPGIKKEELASRIAENPETDPKIAELLANRNYEQRPNAPNHERIRNEIREQGIDKSYDQLMYDLDNKPTDADMTQAGIILPRLLRERNQPGDQSKASQLWVKLSSRMKEGGQAMQVLASLDKLGPEGILNTYRDMTKGPSDEARKPYEPDVDKIKATLDASRQSALQKLQDMLDDPNSIYNRALRLNHGLINEGLAERGLTMRKLLGEWAGKVNATRDSLINDLKNRLGLPPELAEKLGNAIASRFDERLDKARKAALNQIIKRSQTPRIANQASTLTERILKYTHMGMTDDEAAWSALAKTLKLPHYDPDVAKELRDRANEIERMRDEGRSGFQVDNKQQDLLNRMQDEADKVVPYWKQMGESSRAVFYGNIFGPQTVARKTDSELFNAILEPLTMGIADTIRHGDVAAVPRAIQSSIRGMITRGVPDALSIVKTGRALRHSDAEVRASRLVERNKIFSNLPLISKLNVPFSKFYKPVGRILDAGRALFFAGSQEARATMLARRLARKEGVTSESAIQGRAMELLGEKPEQVKTWQQQAIDEGLTGLGARLRVAELMEQSRPIDLMADAREFGNQATFMGENKGFLGVISKGIDMMCNALPPLRFLVPVNHVVTNVFNNMLAYTPAGVFGAARMGMEGKGDYATQQLVKSTLGTLGYIGVYSALAPYMSNPNAPIQINGAGPREYGKLQSLREEGWIPYSIKFGDRYYSFKDNPLAVMLATLGNYSDALKYMPQQDALQRMAYSTMMTGNFLLSASWLSSVDNVLNLFSSDDPNKVQSALEYTFGSTAGALVPGNQSTLKTIDKIFDPTRYKPTDIQGMLMSQVAFARRLSGSVAYNGLGEPIQEHPFAAFTSAPNPDPVWTALAEKQVSIPILRAKIGISPDEQSTFAQAAGSNLKEMLEDGGMERIQELPKDEAQEVLNTMASEARHDAIMQLGIATPARHSHAH